MARGAGIMLATAIVALLFCGMARGASQQFLIGVHNSTTDCESILNNDYTGTPLLLNNTQCVEVATGSYMTITDSGNGTFTYTICTDAQCGTCSISGRSAAGDCVTGVSNSYSVDYVADADEPFTLALYNANNCGSVITKTVEFASGQCISNIDPEMEVVRVVGINTFNQTDSQFVYIGSDCSPDCSQCTYNRASELIQCHTYNGVYAKVLPGPPDPTPSPPPPPSPAPANLMMVAAVFGPDALGCNFESDPFDKTPQVFTNGKCIEVMYNTTSYFMQPSWYDNVTASVNVHCNPNCSACAVENKLYEYGDCITFGSDGESASVWPIDSSSYTLASYTANNCGGAFKNETVFTAGECLADKNGLGTVRAAGIQTQIKTIAWISAGCNDDCSVCKHNTADNFGTCVPFDGEYIKMHEGTPPPTPPPTPTSTPTPSPTAKPTPSAGPTPAPADVQFIGAAFADAPCNIAADEISGTPSIFANKDCIAFSVNNTAIYVKGAWYNNQSVAVNTGCNSDCTSCDAGPSVFAYGTCVGISGTAVATFWPIDNGDFTLESFTANNCGGPYKNETVFKAGACLSDKHLLGNVRVAGITADTEDIAWIGAQCNADCSDCQMSSVEVLSTCVLFDTEYVKVFAGSPIPPPSPPTPAPAPAELKLISFVFSNDSMGCDIAGTSDKLAGPAVVDVNGACVPVLSGNSVTSYFKASWVDNTTVSVDSGCTPLCFNCNTTGQQFSWGDCMGELPGGSRFTVWPTQGSHSDYYLSIFEKSLCKDEEEENVELTSDMCSAIGDAHGTVSGILDAAKRLGPDQAAYVAIDCDVDCDQCGAVDVVVVDQCTVEPNETWKLSKTKTKKSKKGNGTAVALGIVFGLVLPLAIGGFLVWYFKFRDPSKSYMSLQG